MKRLMHISLIIIMFGMIFSPAKAQVLDPLPNIEPFVREAVPNAEPVPYTHIREADVMWGKMIWRVIDLREKINHPLYYPVVPTNNRKNLMTVIIEGLRENSIRAYQDDQLQIQLTYEDVMASLEGFDTITLQREFPPYEEFDTVIPRIFSPESVKMFRLMEFWFFDKRRSVLECRIIAMCPVITIFDEHGEFKGFRPLFWIHFPEARRLFARNEVFNRHSDVERRSFDDIFFKRMFNSYISKESNVYDRFISEYVQGLDALLESERVKNDLFVFEHDLWEY